MSTQTLSSTAEIMLEQVMGAISSSCQNEDKQELQWVISTILSQYDIKPALILNGHPDLKQKIKLFLDGIRIEGLSELTLKGYEIELRIFASHVEKATNEITTSDIRTYLSEFSHLKTSTLSKRLSVLKSMFGWLAAEQIITCDPTTRIKQPKKEKRIPKGLTIEELEMIREACVTPRERALVEVFYSTGGRLSEVQALNYQDIDRQSMSILVFGKCSKERLVYFSFKAMYHLNKYLKSRTDDDPALIVTVRKPYRRLSQRGIQREINVIAARSEVKKNMHPHIFRHTFATLTLNNGADIVAVQELLGHASPATTMIYSVLTEEKKKQSHKQYLVQ